MVHHLFARLTEDIRRDFKGDVSGNLGVLHELILLDRGERWIQDAHPLEARMLNPCEGSTEIETEAGLVRLVPVSRNEHRARRKVRRTEGSNVEREGNKER